nr:hypothetical protein BgiMline_022526 [Biomphalaria glabrata]
MSTEERQKGTWFRWHGSGGSVVMVQVVQVAWFRWFSCHGSGGSVVMVQVVQLSWFRWFSCHGSGGSVVMVQVVQVSWLRWFRCHGSGGSGVMVKVVQVSWFRWFRWHGSGGSGVMNQVVQVSWFSPDGRKLCLVDKQEYMSLAVGRHGSDFRQSDSTASKDTNWSVYFLANLERGKSLGSQMSVAGDFITIEEVLSIVKSL